MGSSLPLPLHPELAETLRNANLLPRVDQVRVFDDLAVGLENAVVAVGVPVELPVVLGLSNVVLRGVLGRRTYTHVAKTQAQSPKCEALNRRKIPDT